MELMEKLKERTPLESPAWIPATVPVIRIIDSLPLMQKGKIYIWAKLEY